MPIVIAIFLIIGAFFAGNVMMNPQVESVPTEGTPVETISPSLTPTPTPIIYVTPTPYSTPKPPNETYKQQLMYGLMVKIAARYGEFKNSALQAHNYDKQFLQCISDAEKSCLGYSQPIDLKSMDNQFVAPGQNPVGTPLSDTHVAGLPDEPAAPVYLSPQQQRQLCDGAKSACSPYLNFYKIQANSITSADNDIKEWKRQLVEIVKDCSTCISDYQVTMKKFDELEENIRQSIR